MSILVHGVDKPKECLKCYFSVMSTRCDKGVVICEITRKVCLEVDKTWNMTDCDAMNSCPIVQIEEKEE